MWRTALLVVISVVVASCATPGSAPPSDAAPSTPSAGPTAAARPAPEIATLNIGSTGLTANDWAVMVGMSKQYFQARGLKLEVVVSQNARTNVTALLSRDLQFVSSSPDSGILAIENGAPLTSIAGLSTRVIMRLFARPDITSVEQLRGKSLAVSRSKGPDAAIFKEWLGAAGLTEADYTYINNGGSANRLAAVTSGAAAATLLTPPEDLRAHDQGLRDLGINVGRTRPIHFNVVWTERNWAHQNPDVVKRFIAGLVDACRWLNDPVNRSEAVQILTEHTTLNPTWSEQVYDLMVTEVRGVPASAEIDLPAYQNVLQYLAEFGDLPTPPPPLEKYVDTSFLPTPPAS